MAALGRVAETQRASLFMVIMAAWQVLVSRYSGRHDFAVGVPVSGRTRKKYLGVFGCFVNTLVIRADLDGADTFAEVVGRVQRTAMRAYRHADMPYEQLIDALRVRGQGVRRQGADVPLVNVMLSVREEVPTRYLLSGMEGDLVELDTGTAKFDLMLEVVHTGSFARGTIRCAADLFDETAAQLMSARMLHLAAVLAQDPDRPLRQIDLTTAPERAVLRRGIGRRGSAEGLVGLIHAPIEHQARHNPDALAVTAHGEVASYGDLNAAANRLAHRLTTGGIGPETRVAILIDRSVSLVVALLAVLKASGTFMVIDPAEPDVRRDRMLALSGARVLLTTRDLAGRVGFASEVLAVDDPATVALMPATDPPPMAAPDNLAYLVFSSGSAGEPKGIAVEHRSLDRYLAAIEAELDARPGDVHVGMSSLSGDLWLTSLFPALRTGGVVRFVPRDRALDPIMLARWFGESPCDFLKMTPSHLRVLLSIDDPRAILPRRGLVIGGEPLGWDLADRVGELAPDCPVLNSYGPAEAAVAVLIHRLPATPGRRISAMVPLTDALGDNRVIVLDDAMRLVPPDMPGELFIAGSQLARCYVGPPSATACRFLPDPYGPPGARIYRTGDRVRLLPGGGVQILGRTDRQVKIRGMLIQPAEIENVLLGHPRIEAAAVTATPMRGEDSSLTAYVVTDGTGPLGDAEMRAYVRARLPGQFVPRSIITVPALPIGANGKIDYAALPGMPAPAPAPRSPQAPAAGMERALLDIWTSLLDAGEVGLDDNFFDVGGHSLLLVQLQHRIGERTGQSVTILDLTRHTSIRTLAEHLTGCAASSVGQDSAGQQGVAESRARQRLAARQLRLSSRTQG